MSPITLITLVLATFAAALPATDVRPGGPGGPFGGPPSIPRPVQPIPFPSKFPIPSRPGFPVPSPPAVSPQPGRPGQALTCDTSNAVLTVPPGQTTLPAPSGKPSFVMFGVGTQNYTCGAAGTYTSTGAVAQLFDLSCLASKNQAAFNADIITAAPGEAKLGQHYFQKNDAGALSPVWDFRGDSAKGNANAFVLAAKKGNVAAPTGAQDVDWLFLQSVSGNLATSIYRAQTKGGQPPASCTPGTPDITVPYTSRYWLYGGSVQV
ncbi:hypothetical protein CPB83DRAFT_850831 [Crepidotus variabilis]|uniref:Malate dehydrogenase n=1 Tax=Crepidotus variabilis TaxID=179855 RepID=A0A9P6JRZ6_9AGAR|nr:hypothetical protein CPB83DRAFT_850831 [Crepidotus variabilis]